MSSKSRTQFLTPNELLDLQEIYHLWVSLTQYAWRVSSDSEYVVVWSSVALPIKLQIQCSIFTRFSFSQMQCRSYVQILFVVHKIVQILFLVLRTVPSKSEANYLLYTFQLAVLSYTVIFTTTDGPDGSSCHANNEKLLQSLL